MYTYKEVVEYITNIPKFTKKNTLEDTKAFYLFLGKPGESTHIFHVAGTNGKGSVCAYLSEIYKESGRFVGMFTSPHLVKIEERFRLNGIPISQEEFVQIFQELLAQLKEYEKYQCLYHPSFFELLFFMGMMLFEKKGVEIIILETGLGGRLDATNIVENPCVTIITEIGMDHQEYLGTTLKSIAYEKAGIIKKKVPLVYWGEKKEVKEVLEKKANVLLAKRIKINRKSGNIQRTLGKSIDFSYQSRYYGYIECTINTIAKYQAYNAFLAIAAIEEMRSILPIYKEAIVSGLKKAKWEGRMEEVEPNIYLDGAHNVDGIRAFLETVQFLGKGKHIVLFSAVRDKNIEKMVELLAREKRFREICITRLLGSRSTDLERLEKAFEKEYGKQYNNKVTIIENVEEAYLYCKGKMQEDEKSHLYVVGSLYLVGLIKELNQQETLKAKEL